MAGTGTQGSDTSSSDTRSSDTSSSDTGTGRDEQVVEVGGRTLKLTNLGKVLYPETGTTKGDVIGYFTAVAPHLIAYAQGRPATRKRWVEGVGTAQHPGDSFFQKNLDASTPDWVARGTLHHKQRDVVYPLVNDVATLVWLAQTATLEIHVPQWRFDADGSPGHPDRMVFDLDPGQDAGLSECVEVAKLVREILQGMGMAAVPVTSGSKGIHLYAPLDGTHTSGEINDLAHELARALEADHPDLVISTMRKSERRGKVLLDWSQNNANKTTVAPYSLRGRLRPTVAFPRTWSELDSPDLHQVDYHEATEILARREDAAAALLGRDDETGGPDRLERYRSMRDAGATPEPVPPKAPPASDGASFVIQKHAARRLHYDFRLEHDGVLVSWAVPKGVPGPGEKNHLAVHVEDHPLEYATFSGDIPKGHYGAGHVDIWDHGTYDVEKWGDDEIIVILHGAPDGGLGGAPVKVALLRTALGGQDENWLIHRMSLDGADHPDPPAVARPPSYRPMLAKLATASELRDLGDVAVEMKWDGMRALAYVWGGETHLVTRNGIDVSGSYPELAHLADLLDGHAAVLDGEIIAVDRHGHPDFGLLQQRMHVTAPAQVRQVAAEVPVRYVLFDLLWLDGTDFTGHTYTQRRAALEHTVRANDTVLVPPVFDGTPAEGLDSARELHLEGVVLKQRSAHYIAGGRSTAWLKWKLHATQEVVVGGWRPGKGRRAGGVGSLLLAIPDGDQLRYVGRVGTGFSDRDLDDIQAQLAPLARKTSPLTGVPDADARDAHWVTPKLVGEVQFASWTEQGFLRQATWRGWRPDKSADEVVRES